MSKTKQEIYNNRPISPHLSIYRKQISSVLSILHRITGAGLFFSLSIIAWWFVVWVFSGYDVYYINLVNSGLVKLALLAISLAIFYHLCTGIRHLIWDMGIGFSIEKINYTGLFAVATAAILTISFWYYIL